MPRKYVSLSAAARTLRVGDYLLHHGGLVSDADSGEQEILLVITDTSITGPGRSKSLYLVPGQEIEISPDIRFRFFLGARQQLRGVVDAPADVPVGLLEPGQGV